MADNRKYFVLCADNCKFESMTKEQILTAITQAVEEGNIRDVDTGFITKIVEQNKQAPLSFWVGTSAEYNALKTKAENCFYIISDDVFKDDLLNQIKTLKERCEAAEAAVALYNTPLFAGEATAGDTITLDASKHSYFAVTIETALSAMSIICGKTETTWGLVIGGGTVGNISNNNESYYYKVSLKQASDTTFTIAVAQISETADFEASAGNAKVTKVVGIM